jgi:hypothetical protein
VSKAKAKKATAAFESTPEPKREVCYVLRVCGPSGESTNDRARGFRWPLEAGAVVVAPDWNPRKVCGYGLHGWLNGMGDLSVCDGADAREDSRWLVLEVFVDEIVELDGKVKFPSAKVILVGNRSEAATYIKSLCPNSAVHYATSTSGDRGTSTSGYRGTSTSGDGGTSTSGDRGTSTSGDGGTSTSGDRGTSTSGDGGTSTSGDGGTSTSGDGGTSTSGYRGTSTSGEGGTSTSGYGGALIFTWYDESANRYRKAMAEVDGIHCEAGVPYVCVGGKIIRKDSVQS